MAHRNRPAGLNAERHLKSIYQEMDDLYMEIARLNFWLEGRFSTDFSALLSLLRNTIGVKLTELAVSFDNVAIELSRLNDNLETVIVGGRIRMDIGQG